MITIARALLIVGVTTVLPMTACQEEGSSTGTPAGDHEHTEGDGHDHEGHSHEGDSHTAGVHDDVEHGEAVALGTVSIGGIEVEAFQGHGMAEPGKELHLLVKLGEADAGGATVRGWIGTDDRFQSVVALAEYSADEGGYELHATAPDPLPEGSSWWVEVRLPDGTTHVGSVPLK